MQIGCDKKLRIARTFLCHSTYVSLQRGEGPSIMNMLNHLIELNLLT